MARKRPEPRDGSEYVEPALQSAEGKLYHATFLVEGDAPYGGVFVAVGELEDCRPVYRAIGGLEDPHRFDPVEGWTYPSVLKWSYLVDDVLSDTRELSERSLRHRYPAAWPPPPPPPSVAGIIEGLAEDRGVVLRRRLR